MPIQETIIVVGFCIALVRSKPSISVLSLGTMATIFFFSLVLGAVTSMLVEARFDQMDREYSEKWTGTENPNAISPDMRVLLIGLGGGLVAGFVLAGWRWAPGIRRKPVLRNVPWIFGSALIWAVLYYLDYRFGTKLLNVPGISCYDIVMFRCLGGAHLLWFLREGARGVADPSSI